MYLFHICVHKTNSNLNYFSARLPSLFQLKILRHFFLLVSLYWVPKLYPKYYGTENNDYYPLIIIIINLQDFLVPICLHKMSIRFFLSLSSLSIVSKVNFVTFLSGYFITLVRLFSGSSVNHFCMNDLVS